MRYSLTSFVGITTVVALGFAGYGYWLYGEIRVQHKINVEDSLNDFANSWASHLSLQTKGGKVDTAGLNQAFETLRTLNFQANIHGVIKDSSAINVYITDERGIVLYDSRSEANIGKDFSRWNDVFLTLQGKYGARSTRVDPTDPFSSEFFVSAPIRHENRIIGVISVSKSEESFSQFITKFQNKILFMFFIALLGAMAIAALVSYWLTRPVEELMKYAQKVTEGGTEGETARPPQTPFRNFKSLGEAFEKMRISLAGKESQEEDIQHLTHEMKSPLSGIKSNAILLGTDGLSQDKKKEYLRNIGADTDRAARLLDELLDVAKLETQSSVNDKEQLSLKELIREAQQTLGSRIEQNNINLEVKLDPPGLTILGDQKLIQQILNELIINAIAFSPIEGTVLVEALEENNKLQIFVRDQGPGIPDYAKEKIFDKFYSLVRPSGEMSSGLGLYIVKTVLALHSAEIQLVPPTEEMSGANFKISFN
jgi:two-component system sensor histidine kinase CreC